MSRIQIVRRAFKEWHDKVEKLPTDDKVLAYVISIIATIVVIGALVGLVALVLSVLASFWWVLVVGAGLWYFWPQISDLIKKRG